MTNKVRLFPPAFRILDAAGILITTGAKIYVYQPTSTTPATTYSDYSGGTPLANPYIVPSTGIADMWATYGTFYRIVVKTPADVTLADMDYVVGIPDSVNTAVLGNIVVGTLTATTISGTLGSFVTDNASNNTVTNVITVTHTTSGTPGTGIGTGIAYKSESGDESPSDIGQTSFSFLDVTAGSEDSKFSVFTRTAGAALKKAYEWLVTGVGDYLITGAPTATRTITYPDYDLNLTHAPTFAGPTVARVLTMADAALDISAIGTGVTIPASADLTTVYAKLGLSGSQTITASTTSKLTFDTVTYDNKSWWDATNKRYVPLKAGAYKIEAAATAVILAAEVFYVRIYLNGSLVAVGGNGPGVNSTDVTAFASTIITMNGTTDYIEAFFNHTSASSRSTSLGTSGTYLVINRIGTT